MAIEYVEAAKGLAASACHNVLTSLRALSSDESATAALQRIHNLRDNISRAADQLDNGEAAFRNGHSATASHAWSEAITLMDKVTRTDARSEPAQGFKNSSVRKF